ncbi:hypothetical protein TREMEDRAFT_65135 [Tremella mesenterica DSM 1558]|uniref:uncharacterized protein n=1 Tax=Tremella mesenterica (strain ATCC 24925 / CBS 8224 / DSM 1558 / NBRC 9311 / NRRL Y-6157 / RJB 2259-6 / UBC 559-6) TaxID=578456 RepID=UPI00032CAB68|nr:uncharacterized protein TREMEDRAFT_65135 [Tremella mesenterica DSM 1558]EIW66736.1 hypothetical protein TREMEDRAFT_65135 [Tremella mesenterica DSM 1558]
MAGKWVFIPTEITQGPDNEGEDVAVGLILKFAWGEDNVNIVVSSQVLVGPSVERQDPETWTAESVFARCQSELANDRVGSLVETELTTLKAELGSEICAVAEQHEHTSNTRTLELMMKLTSRSVTEKLQSFFDNGLVTDAEHHIGTDTITVSVLALDKERVKKGIDHERRKVQPSEIDKTISIHYLSSEAAHNVTIEWVRKTLTNLYAQSIWSLPNSAIPLAY